MLPIFSSRSRMGCSNIFIRYPAASSYTKEFPSISKEYKLGNFTFDNFSNPLVLMRLPERDNTCKALVYIFKLSKSSSWILQFSRVREVRWGKILLLRRIVIIFLVNTIFRNISVVMLSILNPNNFSNPFSETIIF